MLKNGHGFELKEPKFPNGKPLYNLHRIAANKAAMVWIVEGEKCADALTRLGLVASTSGGANSAKAADWSTVKGRTVVIWRDNDEAGLQYANDVTEKIKAAGCAVQWVDIAPLGLASGQDVADW